jgi:hypothetical protein
LSCAFDALAAPEEVVKFIPPGMHAVPAQTPQHDDPARYTREWLETLRHTHTELVRACSRELN